MRQVVVNLPLHSFYLLANRSGKVVLALALCPFRFLRQNGQRRLQSMRKVAGLGLGASNGLLALLKQAIEDVDERLHFRRIAAFDLILAAFANFGEALTQLIELGQSHSDLQKSAEDKRDRETSENNSVPVHE